MNSPRPYNENELLNQLKGGSEAAFQKVYEKHADSVFRFSKGYLKDRELAEEVVQETFLKVWENRSRIDHTRSFESFLFTIARNTALNQIKKASIDRELCESIYYSGQGIHDELQDQLEWQDYEGMAREAIDSLPKKRREVFLLAREDGLTYAEIGEKLDISTSTVKSHMQIAMQDIRYYLETHGGVSFSLFLLFWAAP